MLAKERERERKKKTRFSIRKRNEERRGKRIIMETGAMTPN